MLKKTSFYSLFALLAVSSVAQKNVEVGVFAGRSYYLGELNPRTHLGDDIGNLSVGGILRYNLNMRYSIKAFAIRASLSAEDQNVDFSFNNLRRGQFSTNLWEFSGIIEFNFFPYELGDKTHWGTPYLFVGLSYFTFNPMTQIEGFGNPQPINIEGGNSFAVPFGLGFKVNLTRKFALSTEWGFRRTGTDLIDGLENRVNDIFETGKNQDNDWYVISGFSLTYKITNEGFCPVYNF